LLAIAWVSALFLAGYTIIYGVYFVSLQEFTGMALVAGGLLSRNSYIRGFLWLLAGWTKAPFIWLSIAFGVQKISVKSRRLGLVFLSLGILSISVMALSAQLGSYTSGRLILSPWHLWANVESLGTYGALFLFVSVIGLVLLAPCIKVTGETLVLLLAALLYAANLLPWNTIGYYNAPVWFLLTCAVATAIKPSSDKAGVLTTKWTMPIMVGCLAASGLLAAETFRTDVFGRNQMVVEGRDWILNNLQPNESYFIYDFSNAEFQFYLSEEDQTWTRDTPPQWKSGQPRPIETLDADYVVATNEVPLAPELTKCAPIKVWPRGFLAPLNC
jgi:hypothetical protein